MQPTSQESSRNRDAPMMFRIEREGTKKTDLGRPVQAPSGRMGSTPMGIRTSNLLIRSQMLYPVELWAHLLLSVFPPLRRGDYSVFYRESQGII